MNLPVVVSWGIRRPPVGRLGWLPSVESHRSSASKPHLVSCLSPMRQHGSVALITGRELLTMATKHTSAHARIQTPLAVPNTMSPNAQSQRPDSHTRHQAVTGGLNRRRLIGWITRALNVMLGDFKLIDVRSLDVLLVCGGDLTCGGVSSDTESQHAP